MMKSKFVLNPVGLPQGKSVNFIHEFALSGSFPLDIIRATHSDFDPYNVIGPQDMGSFDFYITDGESGYEVRSLDRYPVSFPKLEPKPFASVASGSHKNLRLERLQRSGIRLRETDLTYDLKKFPSRVWRPISIEDRNGNRVELKRDADGLLEELIHPDGLRLEFYNNELGLRTGYDLVAPDGERRPIMRYRYDEKSRLIAAENHFGESWVYGYDQAGNRDFSKDMGATETRHIYDGKQRVSEVKTNGIYKSGRMDYHPNGKLITVYHGAGDQNFEKLYFDKFGRHFMTALPDGSISYRHFNDDHELIGETDANGNRTSYEYDAFGNMQSIKDGEGRETFMVWDDMGNLLTHIDNKGNKTRYSYDDRGNLIQSQSPIGTLAFFAVNENGLPVKITRDDGLSETRRYDERNRLIEITDFAGNATKFAYDAFNRPLTITDAAGNTTTLHYDDKMRGRDFYAPSSITRPDGVTTKRSYNPTGTIQSLTDGEGRTTQYEYGPYNTLEAIIDPKGNKLKFAYNSQEQLTQVTNQLGLHWTFERDNCGRVRTETDFDGRTLKYEYDPAGRVIKRTNPDETTLAYEYDKSGRITKLTATELSGEETITTYAYDDNGALEKASNPDATVELERDPMGRIIRESQNGIDILSAYDCCSNRFRREISHPAIGDQKLHLNYDPSGLVKQWELEGHSPLHFARNILGQETERYAFSGFLLRQKFDQIGQLQTQQAGKVTFADHDPESFSPTTKRSYAWSKAFDPLAIASTRWGEKSYTYDQNGQITKTSYAQTTSDGQAAEHFRYNRDLNLAGSGEAAPHQPHQQNLTGEHDQFQNWQTSAAGVVKAARGPRGEIIELEHDACGRVISRRITEKGFRPKTWRFTWNAMDQLKSCVTSEGEFWAYAYDPFGRRISKECKAKSVKTEFIWDGDILAFEINAEDVTEWFYEPESFRPLAKKQNGQLYFIVNDHLGTPKEAYSERGEILWAADHHTWGSVKSCWMSASLDEVDTRGEYLGQGFDDKPVYSVKAGNTALAYEASKNPNPLFVPIRFQGQYEDAETGLFYNRHRFYDSISASYISIDPARIQGGPRLSAYVIAVSKYVDPLGLKPCCIYDIFQDPCALLNMDVGDFVDLAQQSGYDVLSAQKDSTHFGVPWDQGGVARVNNIPGMGNVMYHPGGGFHGSSPYWTVDVANITGAFKIPLDPDNFNHTSNKDVVLDCKEHRR